MQVHKKGQFRQVIDARALAEWHEEFVRLRAVGDLVAAGEVCRRALRRRRYHVHWRVRLACCLFGQGEHADACKQLEIAHRHALHPIDKQVVERLWQRARYALRLAA